MAGRVRLEWDADSWFRRSAEGDRQIVDLTLETWTRRHIAFVLEYTKGHKKWAADELGVDITTLRRWQREWKRKDGLLPAERRGRRLREG